MSKSLPLGVCEISRKTGISAAHVSKVLNGKRIPSLSNAALIAKAMGVSLDRLYRMLYTIQERLAGRKSVPRLADIGEVSNGEEAIAQFSAQA